MEFGCHVFLGAEVPGGLGEGREKSEAGVHAGLERGGADVFREGGDVADAEVRKGGDV